MTQFKTFQIFETLIVDFYAFLPQLILGALTLVIGIIIGKWVYKAVRRLLKSLSFDKAAETTGLTTIAKEAHILTPFSEIIATLVKYVIYLIAIMLAFDIFNLPMIGEVLSSILSYLPRLIGAVSILIVGFIISGFIADLVGKAVKGAGINKIAEDVGVRFGMSELAEGLTRYFLYIAVILISLSTLQISTNILTQLITILMGGVVLAGVVIIVLALKDIAPNIGAGLYFESNKTFKKGQKIEFGGNSGVIEEVGFVYTIIKTRKGSLRVPNRELLIQPLRIGK